MKGKVKKKSESNLAKSSTSLRRGGCREQKKQSLGGADKASRAIKLHRSSTGGLKRLSCQSRHPENSTSDCIGSEVGDAAIKWLVVGEQEAAIRRSRCGSAQASGAISPFKASPKQLLLLTMQMHKPSNATTSSSVIHFKCKSDRTSTFSFLRIPQGRYKFAVRFCK